MSLDGGWGGGQHYARRTCNVLFRMRHPLITRLTGSSYCLARAISCVLRGDQAVAAARWCFHLQPLNWTRGRSGRAESHSQGRPPCSGEGGTFHSSTEQLWITLLPFVKNKKQTNKKKNNFLCNICFWVLGFEIFWVVKPTPLVPVCWYFVQ